MTPLPENHKKYNLTPTPTPILHYLLKGSGNRAVPSTMLEKHNISKSRDTLLFKITKLRCFQRSAP